MQILALRMANYLHTISRLDPCTRRPNYPKTYLDRVPTRPVDIKLAVSVNYCGGRSSPSCPVRAARPTPSRPTAMNPQISASTLTIKN